MGYASFTMTEFRYRSSQQRLNCSHFFLAITTPHAHGDLDGPIISYSSEVSISFLHASHLFGVMRLAPSLCGTAVSSSSISCSTNLQHPITALCLEKIFLISIYTSLMASIFSSVTFPLKFFTFSVISYLDFNGSAYPSFRSLWIASGITRVINKTLT